MFVNFNFMRNLANIFEWQSEEELQVEVDISLGANFTILDGHLQLVFLDILSDLLERFALAENRENWMIVDLIYEWIGYAERFKPFDVNRLNTNALLSLVQKMSANGLLLIRYLPGSTSRLFILVLI